MLKLSTKSAPTKIDLPLGVKVHAPPLTVAALRAAEYRAYKAHSAAKEAMGIDDGAEPDETQTAALEGIFAEAMIIALADKIVSWEGLAGDDGQPLPLSAEARAAFAMHPTIGPAFRRAYEQATQELVAEGNALGHSGAGDTVAASVTAEAA